MQGSTVVIDPLRPVDEILSERKRLPSFNVPASLAETVFRRAASDTRGGRSLNEILAALPQFDPQTSSWPVARDFVEAAARQLKKLPEVRVFLRYATEQLAIAGSAQAWAAPFPSRWAARDMLDKAADHAGILKDVWIEETQAASVAYWATLDA